MEWETVLGLEIHAQLATNSKIFSGASTAYGSEPNTQACVVSLGMPGVLPVLNKEVVRMAVKFGLAIGAQIDEFSVFARKNYFYPDLPKGYQISQFEKPIIGLGFTDIEVEEGKPIRVGITRAHLEEDAGKSLHEDYQGMTGIDLNRAGTPLLEIVSEPDMRSPQEAVAYMKKIHSIVRYLGICDGNMAEGSFRCDANVSIRPKGQKELGTRTELKNINSFRNIEKAINYEVERQIDVLESGGTITQETRLYDADQDETRPMRSKEEANDYRYFPDPDLLPVQVSQTLIEEVRKTLPELPDDRKKRFVEEIGLSAYDAGLLTADRELADYFETTTKAADGETKLTANWVNGELSAALNKENKSISESPINAEQLGQLVMRIKDNTISGKIAKQVFASLWNGEGETADAIIEDKGLKQMSDSGELEALVNDVIEANPDQVQQYRAGKTKVMGFFVGQIMKNTGGKANPGQINQLLKAKLDG